MATPEDHGLTEKQESFAVLCVKLGSQAEAYRQAYDTDPNARDSWIYVEASQLADHPKVSLRIKELQDKAAKRNEFTIHKAFQELEDARKLAHDEGQAGAAVSAVTAKVKLAGFEPAQKSKVEVVGEIKSEISASDKLAEFLAAKSS